VKKTYITRRSQVHGKRERLNIKPGKIVKGDALAKLKADKEEQEKKKLTALPEQSNNDKETPVHEETGSEEIPLENSVSMKASYLKKSSSELVESSKVGVVIPASTDRDVYECSAFSARMKMKLPLQQTNVMADNLAVTGNEMSVQNDPNDSIVCDSAVSHRVVHSGR